MKRKTITLILVLFFVFLVILIFAPRAKNLQQKRWSMSCHNNLEHIYAALLAYANDNDDYFPEGNDLSILVKEKYLDPNFLICPACQSEKQTMGNSYNTSYIYFGGHKLGEPESILCQDKKGNHKGSNTLYSTGFIETEKGLFRPEKETATHKEAGSFKSQENN